MIVTCPRSQCTDLISSACVFYEGMSLLNTNIKTNDSVEIAIQKIDQAIGTGGGGTPLNVVEDYRSSFEEIDNRVYAGYNLNTLPAITRTIDGVLQNAINLTNLETDWANRLNLTYV